MSAALTPWFPEHKKPAREGVYITDAMAGTTIYQYWDGSRWGGFANSIERAAQDGAYPSAAQRVMWRGLASDPSVKP